MRITVVDKDSDFFREYILRGKINLNFFLAYDCSEAVSISSIEIDVMMSLLRSRILSSCSICSFVGTYCY